MDRLVCGDVGFGKTEDDSNESGFSSYFSWFSGCYDMSQGFISKPAL